MQLTCVRRPLALLNGDLSRVCNPAYRNWQSAQQYLIDSFAELQKNPRKAAAGSISQERSYRRVPPSSAMSQCRFLSRQCHCSTYSGRCVAWSLASLFGLYRDFQMIHRSEESLLLTHSFCFHTRVPSHPGICRHCGRVLLRRADSGPGRLALFDWTGPLPVLGMGDFTRFTE
ncbi:hypothetical protein DENSPDRAFT_464047 [Dentipellis sp. KUC8613]|nr:hypothetical protein DENSPDRAFT_464047 [Dentipellis sp. KUC8613]